MCAQLRAGHFQSRVILVYIIGLGIPIGLEAYAVDCSDVMFIMSGIDLQWSGFCSSMLACFSLTTEVMTITGDNFANKSSFPIRLFFRTPIFWVV